MNILKTLEAQRHMQEVETGWYLSLGSFRVWAMWYTPFPQNKYRSLPYQDQKQTCPRLSLGKHQDVDRYSHLRRQSSRSKATQQSLAFLMKTQ